MIEDALEVRLGVRLSLARQVIRVIKRFTLLRSAFRKLLAAHQTKVVVCVVAYAESMAALIAAARDLKITVVEVQHGTLSPFHLGYHYPHHASPYFCDYLLTFGDFWQQAASFPLLTDRLKVLGFAHLHQQLSAYTQHTRAKQRSGVLWLSQGVISKVLTQYALTTAQLTPQFKHTYKLHPSEYKTWRQDYPLLAEAADAGMITVVDQPRQPLYELMWYAEYQVGVFSTAMYEGLALGCYTFIVDLPGAEYMEQLVAQGVVELCRSPSELAERLNQKPQSNSLSSSDSHDQRYFASENTQIATWLIELTRTSS